jgi:hypothetical protein
LAHDVFISYADEDRTFARQVCAALEEVRLRCWLASRDLVPGTDWGGAIIAAIRSSRVMVLVFSEHANTSKHVPRELERAIDHEIPIIPLRIQNIAPRGSLEYSLSSVHWFDAMTPPLETHLARLGQTVRTLLGNTTADARPAATPVAAGPAYPSSEFLGVSGAGLAPRDVLGDEMPDSGTRSPLPAADHREVRAKTRSTGPTLSWASVLIRQRRLVSAGERSA